MSKDELLPLVDENGAVIGSATRSYCHGGAKPLHPVVHLHVINSRGDIYLQKRSPDKDIQPGKWDTAVGGHVDYGEDIVTALRRESREELGLGDFTPQLIGRYVFESDVERELVNSYAAFVNDDAVITPDPLEISEGRFWTVDDLEVALDSGMMTPNFVLEYRRFHSFFRPETK